MRLIEKRHHDHLVRDDDAAARQAQAMLLERLQTDAGQAPDNRDASL